MNSPVADPQVVSVRTPPHSIEAEQSVLGGLLPDNSAWDRVADMVTVGDFYRHDHRLIFQAIARLIDHSRPADVVTVYESLQSAGKAEEAGGLAYLNALAQNTPSAANIRRYGEIVRDRSVLRHLVTVGDEIATSALNPKGRETKNILDEAESKVFPTQSSFRALAFGLIAAHRHNPNTNRNDTEIPVSAVRRITSSIISPSLSHFRLRVSTCFLNFLSC